jgi:hypothetical protein
MADGLEPAAVAAPSARDPARIGHAVLFAGIAGLAGAFLWDRLTLWSGGGLTVLAVALGWGTGAALRSGAGGPDRRLPWIGAAMAALAILIGLGLGQMTQEFRLRPELSHEAAGVPFPLQVLLFTAAVPTKLGLLDWLFVYLGIYAAWRAARGSIRPTDRGYTPGLSEWEEVAVATRATETPPTPRAERPPFPSAPPPPMGPPPREGEGRH